MTKRPYDPALRATVADAIKAAEEYQAAQRERLVAIAKARRDIAAIHRGER